MMVKMELEEKCFFSSRIFFQTSVDQFFMLWSAKALSVISWAQYMMDGNGINPFNYQEDRSKQTDLKKTFQQKMEIWTENQCRLVQ